MNYKRSWKSGIDPMNALIINSVAKCTTCKLWLPCDYKNMQKQEIVKVWLSGFFHLTTNFSQSTEVHIYC